MVRVLHVDPDPVARAGLARRIVRMEGIELVGSVGDADEARDVLEHGGSDVVLVDLHLRQTEECRLCQELRALTDVPVIAHVSFMTEERWQRLSAAGASAYLLRRIDTDRFRLELTRLATGTDGTRQGA